MNSFKGCRFAELIGAASVLNLHQPLPDRELNDSNDDIGVGLS